MEIDLLTSLINNMGFPIAVCIALFYQNMKTNESFNELQKTVYQNTAVTQQNTQITQQLERTLKNSQEG